MATTGNPEEPELLQSGTPVLRVGNLFTSTSWYYSDLVLDDDKYIDKNDLIYAWSASFGPFIWEGEKVIYHYHIWKMDFYSQDELDKKFIYYYLLEKTQEIKASGSGIAMIHMTKERMEKLPVPVPPLEEQKRIVAKVDELMALCDKLEAQQQKRRKLQTLTRTTALNALANAQSPHELKDAWSRLQGNLPLLISNTDDVWQIKQTIIDLGMSGYFISDNEKSANTGESLLKKIEEKRLLWELMAEEQELKEAQTMRRKIKKQKVMYPDRYIPKKWSWGSFLEISQAVVDCHNKTAPYVSDGIHLVRTTDIRNAVMDLRNTKKITSNVYDYWARRMPPRPGDIFFTREAPMGEAAVVPEGEKVCLGQRTMLIRLFHDCFDKDFLIFAIYSPSFIDRMINAGVGATVKHLRVGSVEDLVVPVPPIEEQRLTVNKIKKLFSICDQLIEQRKIERRISKSFSQSAVASITGTEIKEDQKMKIPKTELASKLKLKFSPNNKDQAPLSAILAKHNGELSSKALWNYSGLEIDAFYQQLKTEMARDWIVEPEKARMIEIDSDNQSEAEAG